MASFQFTSFREIISRWLDGTPWLSAYWGSRYIFTVGLVQDTLMTAAHMATRAATLDADSQPDDALSVVGRERLMPAYPAETVSQYRARLLAAWDAWSLAGTPDGIASQFAAAGYTGVTVYRPTEWFRSEPGGSVDYWSQFWVFIPNGNGFQSEQQPWGGGLEWGEGPVWGSGVESEIASTVAAVTRKWKPLIWIGQVVLEAPDTESWDTGHTWDEVGLTWGSSENGVINIT